ncbi:MAG: molybdopterin cofactor-binding domain-containing protein, partial [Pseudobdellovibrionaceae bacterium]
MTIGKTVLRKEGVRKVTGQSLYVDDMPFEGLHGVTVRSTIARGKIKKITYKPGVNWSEFVIVTAKDIPGKNAVALILYDQPYLAEEMINHPEEAILLIAHPDKHLAEKARTLVDIQYEEMPAIFSIEEALQKKTVIWGTDNILKSYLLEKGQVDSVWQKADFVIEEEYQTGAQEQLYIEPNGMIAIADAQDGVTIWGSM